ncbi:hypothetical protein BGZ80_006527, partial [Entomortierella chlamydospora]
MDLDSRLLESNEITEPGLQRRSIYTALLVYNRHIDSNTLYATSKSTFSNHYLQQPLTITNTTSSTHPNASSSAVQMDIDNIITVLTPAPAIAVFPLHFLIHNYEDNAAPQQLLLEGLQILRLNQNIAFQTLRTADDGEVTNQIKNDYLRDLENQLESYTQSIEEQRSLLHELQQLNNSISAVSTNPAPSKSESKEKDLTFPNDLSKFGEVGYRNAQEYIFTASNFLRLRRVNVDNPKTLASYLGMAIKNDKKRNEYTTNLFALEESADMTVDDVHKLGGRVYGTTAQTVATSKKLLEMRRRHDEIYHEFGSRTELQVKRTGTHDKTPAIISHLFSDASSLARTDLKLWLLVRDYKHCGLPFPDAEFTSLSDLTSAYQFLESPTRSESMDSSQSSSGYKNKSRSDNKRKSYSNRDRRDDSPSSAGSKRSSDNSAQKDNHKKARVQLVCTNCPHLSNHVTKDCKAPMCHTCRTRHSRYYCPKNNANATKPANNAIVALTPILISNEDGVTIYNDVMDLVNTLAS